MTLASVDAANHYLTYSIDDGPEPINSSAMTSYIGAVKLYPVTTDGTTFVEWTSKCETTDDGRRRTRDASGKFSTASVVPSLFRCPGCRQVPLLLH